MAVRSLHFRELDRRFSYVNEFTYGATWGHASNTTAHSN